MIVKNESKSSIKILSYINDGKTNYKHIIVKNVSKTSIMIFYLIKNDYKTKFCAHSCEEYSVVRYIFCIFLKFTIASETRFTRP